MTYYFDEETKSTLLEQYNAGEAWSVGARAARRALARDCLVTLLIVVGTLFAAAASTHVWVSAGLILVSAVAWVFAVYRIVRTTQTDHRMQQIAGINVVLWENTPHAMYAAGVRKCTPFSRVDGGAVEKV